MSEQKIAKEAFVLQAIRNLRKPPYKGIHTVYSNFNSDFRRYYGEDSRSTVDRMVEEGKIGRRFVKGGVMIYLPDDMPVPRDTLSKILGGD